MRAVLFDIDGTLLLTGGAGLEALTRAFRDLHGVEGASDGIEFHGRTDPLILDSIAERHLGRPLRPSEFDAIIERYLVHLHDTLGSRPYRVLPGARALVQALHDQGAALGLATGNVEPAAWEKLRRGELDRYFSFGGFGSDSADRTELTRLAVARGRERAGTRDDLVLVGDTVHDVRCALAVGVPILGVATGNASVADLAAAGASWAVASLEDPSVYPALGLPAPRAGGARVDPAPRP
jgi:phosphoglycolate phosphatase-like HAD superfamily hydrolase